MAYPHLTEDERYTIYEQLGRGASVTEIATSVGRHKSTVSREIQRNRGLRGYRPHQAHGLAKRRQGEARGGRQVSQSTWPASRSLIAEGYSPEQAAGRCRRQDSGRVSHEYLYQRVYADKSSRGSRWLHLRCQKLRRKRYGSGRQLRGRIVGRVGIESCCHRVEPRSIIGHWEGDTVVGRNHRGFLVRLAERRCGFRLTRWVATKAAFVVASAGEDMLTSYHRMVRTVTLHNGLGFAHHVTISAALGCQIYFARPYASWQRSSNENLNGLLRQYFPERSCLAKVSPGHVAEVERRLNARAQKRLDWAKPTEVFGATAKRLGVALASCIQDHLQIGAESMGLGMGRGSDQ